MSAGLTRPTRTSQRVRLTDWSTVDARSPSRKRKSFATVPVVTGDQEIRLLTRVVAGMMLLAVVPLLLFHLINMFFPDLFLVPIAPR